MTISVLKSLAAMGGGASLTALAARLEESPAKVHRYLASLVEGELVLQDPSTSRYLLGPGSIELGLAAMKQSDVVTLATVELTKLAEAHQLSCFVSLFGNRGPTIVRWDEPAQPVTVNVRVGSVLPILWSATGRVFGAYSEHGKIMDLIRAELESATNERRKLLPDLAAVAALFNEIRTIRCSPMRDVLLNGVSAVAAPTFDAAGKAAAVITALGPSGGFDAAADGHAARLVMQAANAVSARLGFRGD